MSFLTPHQIMSVSNMGDTQRGSDIRSANVCSDMVQKIRTYIELLSEADEINKILHEIIKDFYSATGFKSLIYINMTGMDIDVEIEKLRKYSKCVMVSDARAQYLIPKLSVRDITPLLETEYDHVSRQMYKDHDPKKHNEKISAKHKLT